MSPRRFAGWEPATLYQYDDDGRIVRTTPEPEWDDFDVALVDALRNWEAGLFSCGHHRSESDPELVHEVGYRVCRVCDALQEAQEKQKGSDKAELDAGRNPDFPRRWWAAPMTRAEAEKRAAERVRKKTPQQLMDEALRKQAEGSSPDVS